MQPKMKSKWIAVGSSVIFTASVLLLWLFTVHTTSTLDCSAKMVRDFTYPVARRDDSIVEDLHGTKVTVMRLIIYLILWLWISFNFLLLYSNKIADPYRWLEDPDSEETQKYVDAVNKVTQPYLESCEQWHKINEKLTTLWNYPKYNVPDRHGKYYFSYMNTGLQNQKCV